MDLRKLKTLIDLVAESGIAELEVTEGEDRVRIVKHAATFSPPHQSHPRPLTRRPRLRRRKRLPATSSNRRWSGRSTGRPARALRLSSSRALS
jgi:hypothetical protein